MIKINFIKFNKKGFTLIETLVAVSIFSVSLVALMVVLGKGIADTNYAKKKIIGETLAQEGIEYMRNLRDTYVLYAATGQIGWNAFLARLASNSCTGANGCYVDNSGLNYADVSQPMLDLSIAACGSACPELRYNSSTGRYSYSGALSGFTRTITAITSINNEVKVSSRLSWNHAGVTYNVTLSETLFNWVD